MNKCGCVLITVEGSEMLEFEGFKYTISCQNIVKKTFLSSLLDFTNSETSHFTVFWMLKKIIQGVTDISMALRDGRRNGNSTVWPLCQFGFNGRRTSWGLGSYDPQLNILL